MSRIHDINKEMRKQQLKESAHELNYLSARGFELSGMSDADVNDVLQKGSGNSSGSILRIILLVTGVILMAGYIVALAEKTTSERRYWPKLNYTFQEPEQMESITLPEVLISGTVKGTEIRVDASSLTHEHFAVEEESEVNLADLHENISLKPSVSVADNYTGSNTLNDSYNSSVRYIHDLKVTNYQNYYFKKDEPFSIKHGGFEAQYANNTDYFLKRAEQKGSAEKIAVTEILSDGLTAFKKSAYRQCLSAMETLLSLNKDDVNALFYSGLSHFFLGNSLKASERFELILESENNVFHQEAEFYLALAWKQSGELEKARQLFQQIADKKGFYAERAAKLLET